MSTQVTHDRINGRITAISDVQVLGDYSDVPLPKRRKPTAVDLAISENGSVEDEVDVKYEVQECDQPRPKRRKKDDSSRKHDLAMPAGGLDASGTETTRRISSKQMTTDSGSETPVQIAMHTTRFSDRLRQKHRV
jgi:hypothetical protein